MTSKALYAYWLDLIIKDGVDVLDEISEEIEAAMKEDGFWDEDGFWTGQDVD